VIYNVTRTDKNTDREVYNLLGKPFGLLHKLKNGSIGSEPFIIMDCSADFSIDIQSNDYDRKSNIELRPKGIILHYRKKSSSFIWPIAFKDLIISYSREELGISDGRLNVSLNPRVKSKKESAFVLKMMANQAAYLDQ
jgi:hypothetical protein